MMSGDSQMIKTWMFYAQPYGCSIYEHTSHGKGQLIANVTVPEGTEFNDIAYLLRAAPELLNALVTLTGVAESRGIPVDAAKATIVKATYNKYEDVSHVKG